VVARNGGGLVDRPPSRITPWRAAGQIATRHCVVGTGRGARISMGPRAGALALTARPKGLAGLRSGEATERKSNWLKKKNTWGHF